MTCRFLLFRSDPSISNLGLYLTVVAIGGNCLQNSGFSMKIRILLAKFVAVLFELLQKSTKSSWLGFLCQRVVGNNKVKTFVTDIRSSGLFTEEDVCFICRAE